ncbi:MAG: hypothetical protein FJ220_01595 [Kiritimatiellaceae bacterium]|nr:hypothetical protein [Kiritimatiellaceae bacterium]
MTSFAFFGLIGCSKDPESLGLSYSGETHADHVRLLVDETWTDASGQRHVKQEIFDSVYEIIDQAEQFILIDFSCSMTSAPLQEKHSGRLRMHSPRGW